MNLGIVVGCSEYLDPVPSLKYAARDADRFAAVLHDVCGLRDEEIVLMSDSAESGTRAQPGFTNVVRNLSRGRRLVDEGLRVETLFFFFSGHGYHSEETGDDYLLVADSVADDLEHTALSVPSVVRRLAEWRPRHLVMFLDACRESLKQGKALAADALNAPDINGLLPPGHVTFCSCSTNERSYESDTVSGGLFTEALCEALSDEFRCRTLHEINAHLRRRVPELCTVAGKPRQTPVARLEPAEVLNLEIVSAQKRNLWRADIPIGSERRARRVPRRDGPHTGCVGIDFGTCNSLIGLLDATDGLDLIPDPHGRSLVPSVVNFGPDLDFTVGWDALEADRFRPEGTVRHVKRALGTSTQFQVYERSLTPEFITSLILRSLRTNAEERLGAPLSAVVAGYPASFSLAQYNALAAAFELADIEVMRFVGEPSAAGLSVSRSPFREYGMGLVVDLGGGTLDVSVVEVDLDDDGFGTYEVRGTAGNGFLGGIDYDEVLIDYLTERIQSIAGGGVELPGHVLAEIRREAERAKHALTHSAQCLVILRDVELTLGDTRDVPILLDRLTFEAISAHLTAEVTRTIRRAMKEAEEITTRSGKIVTEPLPPFAFTLLAGQGTKVPALRDTVRQISDAPVLGQSQEDTVLRGLVRQAGVLRGAYRDALLLDTSYRGIGVRVHAVPSSAADGDDRGDRDNREDRDPELLLEGDDRLNDTTLTLAGRGESIPMKRSFAIRTLPGGDPVRRLRIVETDGNGPDAGLLPIGVVEIDTGGERTELRLTLDIDANSVMNLSIEDLTRGTTREILLNSRDRSSGELITDQRLTGTDFARVDS